MKHLIQSLLLTFLILSASCSGEKNNDAATVREVDICVYGGTSAGVVAAYSAVLSPPIRPRNWGSRYSSSNRANTWAV